MLSTGHILFHTNFFGKHIAEPRQGSSIDATRALSFGL